MHEYKTKAAENITASALSSEFPPSASSIVPDSEPTAEYSGNGSGLHQGDGSELPQVPNERAEAKQHASIDCRSPRRYYERAEISAALNGLSDDEITRILKRARFKLRGTLARLGCVDIEDLFADAVIRTVEQKRRWARGVSASNHLLGVMKSIGHQRLMQAGRYTALSDLVAALQHWSPAALDAQALVAWLEEKLRDDVMALKVLESMMDELRPRDARQWLGISDKIYWAARKRIRRAAEKLPGAALYRRARQSRKRR